MKERFENIGIHLNIYGGVPPTDPRIENHGIPESEQRLWSVTYGHIDMMQQFLNTNKKYGLFCEDDVMMHKELPELLPTIMNEFEEMKLDILLLGHMTNFKIEEWMQGYDLKHRFENRPYKYHNYHSHHWGAHLYMISRSYAQWFIDNFGNGYADRTITDKNIAPFSPDWTITKNGNRALMYPMLAVEDAKGHYDHYGQRNFHVDSHNLNCIPDKFI
jgi:GR25 family glycosyltransferase involved in LPS biosynthesis